MSSFSSKHLPEPNVLGQEAAHKKCLSKHELHSVIPSNLKFQNLPVLCRNKLKVCRSKPTKTAENLDWTFSTKLHVG